jgi:hypothetical protein
MTPLMALFGLGRTVAVAATGVVVDVGGDDFADDEPLEQPAASAPTMRALTASTAPR